MYANYRVMIKYGHQLPKIIQLSVSAFWDNLLLNCILRLKIRYCTLIIGSWVHIRIKDTFWVRFFERPYHMVHMILPNDISAYYFCRSWHGHHILHILCTMNLLDLYLNIILIILSKKLLEYTFCWPILYMRAWELKWKLWWTGNNHRDYKIDEFSSE